jgi:hypothetical protein
VWYSARPVGLDRNLDRGDPGLHGYLAPNGTMADITLEKNLPHNLDAERSILGSIILENRALNMAQEILREEDF